jgi:hypothetical protein
LDAQFAVSSGHGGLSFFQYDSTDPHWDMRNWRRWPSVNFGMDMDATNMSASFACEYYFHLNSGTVCDYAHGCNRDTNGCIEKVGLKNFWLCYLISMNVPFGRPDDEQARFLQLQAAMGHCFKKHDHTMPLFQSMASRMTTAFRLKGHIFNPDLPHDQQLWSLLRDREWYKKVGGRVSLNRFQSGIQRLEEIEPEWVFDEFESVYCALEMDFLRGRSLAARLKLKPGLAESAPEGGGTTNVRTITIEDRSLREVCANGVAIRAVTLSNQTNHRIVKIIGQACGLVKHWDGKQRQLQRSTYGTRTFVKEQVGGGFMAHLSSLVQTLSCRLTLQKAGFVSEKASAHALDQYEIASEDMFAEVHGNLVMTLTMMRLRRMLYLVSGWPFSMVEILNGDDQYNARTALFKADRDHFDELQAADKDDALMVMDKRHVMRKVRNMQYSAALDEVGSNPAAKFDFEKLIGEQAATMTPTLIVEETIGSMKNTRSVKQARKFRRPAASMAAALAQGVVDSRHKFDAVPMDRPVVRRSDVLPGTNFHPPVSASTIDWKKGVVSTVQTPPYHSPPAPLHGTSTADLFFFRAHSPHRLDLAKQLWQGSMCTVGANIVFGIRDGGGIGMMNYKWHYALFHFDNSCVLTWPGQWVKIPTGNAEYFKFDDIATPSVLPFTDVGGVLATIITWRSYWWQEKTYPKANLSPAIRPIKHGKPIKFKELAARRAFFLMSWTDLSPFAELWNIDLSDCSSLFNVLFRMVKSILQCSDHEVMDILSLRLSADDINASFIDTVLEIDEALSLFEHTDLQEVKAQQQKASSGSTTRKAFGTEFKAKKLAVRLAAKEKISLPKKRRYETLISQGSAKELLPPDTSIWRGLTRQEWCGHCPPRKRIQSSWAEHTEGGAMLDVIKRLWLQWLELVGLGIEFCPWESLLD